MSIRQEFHDVEYAIAIAKIIQLGVLLPLFASRHVYERDHISDFYEALPKWDVVFIEWICS